MGKTDLGSPRSLPRTILKAYRFRSHGGRTAVDWQMLAELVELFKLKRCIGFQSSHGMRGTLGRYRF